MAAPEDDESEKEFDPSERKLAQAREQGDVVRSEDLQTAAGFLGLVAALGLFGSWAVMQTAEAGMAFLANPDRMAEAFKANPSASLLRPALAMAAPTTLLLAGPALAVVVYLLATRSLVLAPTKIAPKLSHLSILSNAKQKFGRAGLVEFAKKFAKLLAVSLLLGLFLASSMQDLVLSARMEPGPVSLLMSKNLLAFLHLFLVIAAVFGLADYLWQRAEFARRNRMTRKEMMDELKESEGDPHMKADRRRRAEAIATNRMLADVPKADVVIVNPTHYAVALAWNRARGGAPRCVAKGTDEIAARIRERAAESGVPIRRDPPTARALYATVDIGREIRPEHYAAVAAAIRFSDAMRRKAGRR